MKPDKTYTNGRAFRNELGHVFDMVHWRNHVIRVDSRGRSIYVVSAERLRKLMETEEPSEPEEPSESKEPYDPMELLRSPRGSE